MGGRPSKGTPADKRLKGNRSSGIPAGGTMPMVSKGSGYTPPKLPKRGK